MNQSLQQANYVPEQTGPSVYVLREGDPPKRCTVIETKANRISVQAGFSTLRAGDSVVLVFLYHPAGTTLLRRRQAAVVGRIRNRVLLKLLPNASTSDFQ